MFHDDDDIYHNNDIDDDITNNHNNNESVLGFIIGFILLILILGLMVYQFYKLVGQEDNIQIQPEPISPQYGTETCFTNKSNVKPEICSICIEPYQNNDTIFTLQCHHTYHKDCISIWYEKKTTCPYCVQNSVISVEV